MNNIAKDLIGRMGSLSLLILLLRLDRYRFPLDGPLVDELARTRDEFHQLLSLLSDLTAFSPMRDELASAVEDLAPTGPDPFYTEEATRMFLAIARERLALLEVPFEDADRARGVLLGLWDEYLGRLFSSVAWLRVAFASCYPDRELPSLCQGWSEFCRRAAELIPTQSSREPRRRLVASMVYWKESEILRSASQSDRGGMPHARAFRQVLDEVDRCLSEDRD